MFRAEPPLENLRSEVAQKGGMLLNTYQWEYAPYLLKLKRRISDNLVPPYAFTRLGLIGGQNLIRFRINPDGSISAITLLWSDSHESLEQTSITAIRKAHPFIPLPSGFPKEFLEITALFTYNNKPQEGRK
jgi:TonB family protein